MAGGLMLMQDNAERMQPRPKAQIRSNVSLPPKFKPGIAQEFPNLRAMRPGDSFEIPWREGWADLVKAVDAAVKVRVKGWAGTKWKVRRTQAGVGVWRIE